MSETNQLQLCDRCGAVLSGYGADRLCAACLLESAILEPNTPGGARASAAPLLAFDDYELLEEIARGGMGVVYRARQISLNRPVAIKLMLGGHLANAADMKRFRAEAETAAQLHHPNIVAIHEVGEHAGQPFFSMDLVQGRNLAQLARDEPLPSRKAATYLKTIAEAVQYAHSRGVLHRDLKPSNILIDENDQPRITDFGLAKRLEGDASLTITGQVLGSPSFIPPEQAAGRKDEIGPPSDVYSLGAILYQLLTGRPPFVADTLTATLRMVAETEPVSPRLLNTSVPRDLETICLKCLQKDPHRRYGSAVGLVEDLTCYLRDTPIHARAVSQWEKAWRWGRRNPALTVTGGAAFLLLLALAIGSPIAAIRIDHERERAEDSAKKEEQQRVQAQLSADRAERTAKLEAEARARAEQLAEKNRVTLYAATIKTAAQTLKAGDGENAMRLLEQLKPQLGRSDLRSFDWYYVWQQCHNERLSLAYQPTVCSVAFSPDSTLLATAVDDGTVRVASVANGNELLQLTGHTGRVAAVAFSPDGRTVASAGEDGNVRIWGIPDGKAIRTLVWTNSIFALRFSPDGNLLALGEGQVYNPAAQQTAMTLYAPVSRSGRVVICDTKNLEVHRVLGEHKPGVRALSFSRDGRLLVSCGLDHSARLYNVFTGQALAVQTNFSGFVMGIVFSHDSSEIFACSWSPRQENSEIKVLDGATLVEKRVLTYDLPKGLCLGISPGGQHIATGGADFVARLWDMTTGRQLEAYLGHRHAVMALDFSADDRFLATAGPGSEVRIWDLKSNPSEQKLQTTNAAYVAFSPDGKLLACSATSVEVRDAATGRLLRVLPECADDLVRIAFAPVGSVLAASGAHGQLHFWDTQTWRHWMPSTQDSDSVREPPGEFAPDSHLAFSPDGQALAMGGHDNIVRIWDVKTAILRTSIKELTEFAESVAFLDHGRTLVTSGQTIRFWDAITGSAKGSINERARLLRVSEDGNWLASQANSGYPIQVRDTTTFQVRSTLPGHRLAVYCLAFSHDSQELVTVSWDGSAKLWHVASGQELLNLVSGRGILTSAAFAPGDRTLAIGAETEDDLPGEMTIVRAATEEKVLSASHPKPLPPPSRQRLHELIPPRAPACSPEQLDLSESFTAPLTNFWIKPNNTKSDLASLPTGLQKLGGVLFDIRGIVQLASGNPSLAFAYPSEVRGITVARPCKAIHFLQSGFWKENPGTRVGEYVIHFADAREQTVPLIYSVNTTDWMLSTNSATELTENTHVAWQGENASSRESGRVIRLFDFVWKNTRPDMDIICIDFKSNLSASAPFLLAITVE